MRAVGEPGRADSGGGAGVVVGVDGSPSSVGALRRGARLATALGVPLTAVTAWSHPATYGAYLAESFVPDGRELEAAAQAVLDETARAAFGDTRPQGFRSSTREGNAAQALIDESRGAEMLVVGSRGHGGFAGLLLGSVSTACAEHGHCPVLVFHDEAPAAA